MGNNLKILFTKGISSLYSNISLNNGFIQNHDKKIYVFKINPLNILTDNPDYLYQIYNAYTTCIRSINCDYRIIRLNNSSDIQINLEYYKKRMSSVQNEGLKKAIFNYVLQLEKVALEYDYITSNYYLLVEFKGHASEFMDYFKPLKTYGFSINYVYDKNTLEQVLRSLLLKEEVVI